MLKRTFAVLHAVDLRLRRKGMPGLHVSEIQDYKSCRSAAANVKQQHWTAHVGQYLYVCTSLNIKYISDSDSRLQGVQLICQQLVNNLTTYTSTIRAPTGG